MSSPTDSVAPPLSARAARLSSFVAERFPFALPALQRALQLASDQPEDDFSSDSMRPSLERAVRELLTEAGVEHEQIPDTTPRTSATTRLNHAVDELLDAVDGFLRREAISASLTPDERREILRGMILTRATDNRLKAFFSGGEVRYGRGSFQGKGFRSLGQEAIYAAAIRLKRGESFTSEGGWRGDVVAPLIRDLGVALAMSPTGEMVRGVLSAQMAKAGPPMNGKDLHVGDFSRGVLPASAPLTISTLTACGLAMAFTREQATGADGRVAFSFIGEGGSSLGEWHEAINLAAARKLPIVFCIQNNQTALATPLNEQTAVRVFADKASGYGIPGVTIDGTDPDAIAATFTWAAERARSGEGPALIELVAMRMCGHAHHDDMLYLGKEPPISWDYPKPTEQGYADREAYAWWSERDPIRTYAARLESEGLITGDDVENWKKEAEGLVESEARKVIDSPWPAAELAGTGVFADEPERRRIEVLDGYRETPRGLPELDTGPPFESGGRTLLDAVMLGVGDALRSDPRVFVYGEDVGGKYGNAFLLLRPLLEEFGDRILNSTLAEGGVLGVCIGAALGGQRPIGEIQFNDFVATGFNQLVNNAAKMRYRWGGGVPMVVRMPWGGLRHAGPYHSQNTEAWFYRTPGLKIVTPSTPYDARALMAAAVADPDPVLFYEHIGLYRDPKIKQKLDEEAPEPLPIGKAALRRTGDDLAIISYGAYVHVAMRVAERLSGEGIEAAVLDLRSVAPLDREAILQVARHCGRVMIIHEDTRTGSIGESIAAIIGEEAFDHLDAPVRIIGSLDTPVPYSPPLEKVFLPSEDEIEKAARLLVGY
ncbi:MAG TPA: thiamine pyrophosphate-dependent enzyme [Thermoanaerobaculia bacterium]|nr:thiamine pyrophosphate-dependent enzyme [Thermoanaerobaculia bacterium]